MNTPTRRSPAARTALALGPAVALLVCAGAAMAQASFPAVFVANNGNLEGSVTSYGFSAAGVPQVIQKFVIGSTPSTSQPVAGTNAYAIDRSPDGRHLLISHATAATTVEQLTLLRVHADGTMSLVNTFTTPDSPLDLQWLTDDLVAVSQTQYLGFNGVHLYRIDPDVGTLSEVDFEDTEGFTAYITKHPTRPLLFATESDSRRVFCFGYDGTGLKLIDQQFAGTYLLGPGVSPDGLHVYGNGGISGNTVTGFSIEASGLLTSLPSTYPAGSTSPKQIAFSPDGLFAYVAHGTTSAVRLHRRDAATGELSIVQFQTQVGIQGSLGDIGSIMLPEPLGQTFLLTDRDTISDGVRGLQAYGINSATGFLTPRGSRIDSTGTSPSQFVTWVPAGISCPADFTGDGFVDDSDFVIFAAAYDQFTIPPADPAADLTGDGFVDDADFVVFAAAYDQFACP